MKGHNNSAYHEWVATGVASGALLLTPFVAIAEREVDQQVASAAQRRWEALVKKVNREAKKGSAV